MQAVIMYACLLDMQDRWTNPMPAKAYMHMYICSVEGKLRAGHPSWVHGALI